MLELAGRIADGVIVLVGVDPPRVRQAIEAIGVGARAAGRALGDIDLVLWVPCAVADAGAREVVKAHGARVVVHPLPYTPAPDEQKVVAETRRAYNYHQPMDPRPSTPKVAPHRLLAPC